MSYVPFSTEKADYFLVYAAHIKDTFEDIFEKTNIRSLDAIVLESVGGDSQILEVRQFGLKLLPRIYESISKAAHAAGKPIYLVDADLTAIGYLGSAVLSIANAFMSYFLLKSARQDAIEHSEKKFSRRQFLSTAAKTIAGLYLLNSFTAPVIASASKGEIPNIYQEISAEAQCMIPTPLIEVRNAVTARKVEQFVAPWLKIERPKIALVYGSGHAGLKKCLQNRQWRDEVLGVYRRMDYLGIKKATLEVVHEIIPSKYGWQEALGLEWETYTYNCDLF